MNDIGNCPVCNGAFGRCRTSHTSDDTCLFDCDGCGHFKICGTALAVWFNCDLPRLTEIQRVALSHALRTASRVGDTPLVLTTDWMEVFVKDARLPTPSTQAANLIALIGDYISENGKGYFIDDVPDTPLVGAFNRAMFNALLQELIEGNLIKRLEPAQIKNPRDAGLLSGHLYDLTLDGWDRYHAEKSGRFAGRYGFIAMKFGDQTLDRLVNEVVKPAVRNQVGYDLIDMRDISQAGVIDNIMRTQIRDAAFVLVDLTHDNYGAYWEAGYAEGLGKPVIYLCEQSKFDAAKTHFDVNHCTTLTWTTSDTERFTDLLIATLRRSLNIFPDEAKP